jgi:hypothetical protein
MVAGAALGLGVAVVSVLFVLSYRGGWDGGELLRALVALPVALTAGGAAVGLGFGAVAAAVASRARTAGLRRVLAACTALVVGFVAAAALTRWVPLWAGLSITVTMALVQLVVVPSSE